MLKRHGSSAVVHDILLKAMNLELKIMPVVAVIALLAAVLG
jgi:hypothetical protein